MLETNDGVVCVPDEYHVPGRISLPPLMSPQVVHVVKIDVRQQWRDDSALRRAFFTFDPESAVENANLQPFLDQADNSPVADAMFDELVQPNVADRVEGRSETLPTAAIIRIR